jgi:hypothetical protein
MRPRSAPSHRGGPRSRPGGNGRRRPSGHRRTRCGGRFLFRFRASTRPRALCPPPGGILPSFFTSTWTSSPSRFRSYRRMGSPVWRSTWLSRLRSWRTRTRWTVDAGMSSLPPKRSGPSFSFRRSRQIRSSTWAGVLLGEFLGRDDRSKSPSAPSSRYRCHHLDAHRLEIPVAEATWAMGLPASMRWQSRVDPGG